MFKGSFIILIAQIFIHFFIIQGVFLKEYILVALFLNVLVVVYAMLKTEKKLDQL